MKIDDFYFFSQINIKYITYETEVLTNVIYSFNTTIFFNKKLNNDRIPGNTVRFLFVRWQQFLNSAEHV